ncbi:hypothetical protein N7475_000245 [Penicillium sp. IBT 31633x]|nr:hypothetical protein N7475_000245 [Penicillium sp. IBT 31633x]
MKYPYTELGTSPAAEHVSVLLTWKEASTASRLAALQTSLIKISHYRDRIALLLYTEAATRPVLSALKISREDNCYGIFLAIINTMRNA